VMDEHVTARGARLCHEWLKTCRDLGWSKKSMPFLCDLFWKYRDGNGDWRNEKKAESQ
jgi:hypothetical protein